MRRSCAFFLLAGGTAVAAACSSFGSNGDSGGTDGGGDDRNVPPPASPAADGGPDGDAGRICTTAMPFGTPTRIDSVSTSTASEATPRLTKDELTMVFESDRLGNFDIYESTRASVAEPFGSPKMVLDVTAFDIHPWISDDRRMLIYASPNGLGDPDEINTAQRPSAAGSFEAGAPLPGVNSLGQDYSPFLTSDGADLYFASTRSGTPLLYVSHAKASGGLEDPIVLPIGGFPAQLGSEFPTPQSGGLTFYFASYEPRDGDVPLHQIWVATRASPTASFGDAKPVSELAATTDTTPGWISPDGCRLYFARQNINSRDIFVASR